MNRKILYAITAMILLLAPLMASGAVYADENADGCLPNGLANALGHVSPLGMGHHYGLKNCICVCNDLDPTNSGEIVRGFYWGD